MKDTSKLSRRNFIGKSAVATFGFTLLPAYLTSARAADNPKLPPSKRLNLGCIGIGGRAAGLIPNLTRKGEALPVAFADVDFDPDNKRDTNLKARPDVPRYNDFRLMFDEMEKDIDLSLIHI